MTETSFDIFYVIPRDYGMIQGSTGNSTGEHIHLEISPTGTDKRITDRAITSRLVLSYIGKIR